MEEREKVYTYTVTPSATGVQPTQPIQPFAAGTGLSTGSAGFQPGLAAGTGLSTGAAGFQSTAPGTFMYTVPPSESISATSRIQPTELAAGPSVHPTEHMVSGLRPTETLETATRLHPAEAISAGMAPPTEAMSALRFEAREVPIQPQQSYQYQREIRPTTITTIPATVITTAPQPAPMMTTGVQHVIPMVPVESHQIPPGSEARIEREVLRTTEVLPTTTTTTTVGETFLPTTMGTTMGTTYTTTPMATVPVTTTPISTTAAAATTAAVAHEEKKGFFSHLFHHHATAPATTTAVAGVRDPLTEQAERFIDNLSRHPRELSYYEQFVVQYNRGMRFTPMQARRLAEVLIKNSSASRGVTVPYYSVYALELLLKLAIADPIVHAELARIDDQQLSLLRMDRYIGNDETKILGLNFLLYLHRFLGRTRYQDWVVSKKPEKDRALHTEIDNYILSQQTMEIAMFLEGISRRLPPLLPHAPIGEHLLTTTVIEKPVTTTIIEPRPIPTTTVTEIVREVPATTTTLSTSGTSTIYKPAY